MGVSANMPNVDFQYGTALAAAADLSQLASVVNDKAYAWTTEAGKARQGWEGGHESHFAANVATAGTDAETITTHLAALATTFAEQWARARGEQDRINHARWVEAEEEDDSWVENVGDWFYDSAPEPPPGNPPTPSAQNGWQPTREPIHPEFENRGAPASV